MKIKELIADLQAFDPEKEIMILDGFNGGGVPRTINLGPTVRKITESDISECSDCEEVGFLARIVVISFGSY